MIDIYLTPSENAVTSTSSSIKKAGVALIAHRFERHPLSKVYRSRYRYRAGAVHSSSAGSASVFEECIRSTLYRDIGVS